MSETVKRLLNLIKKAKIVVCGLDYAGKTSLVNYLKVGHLTITIPTFGLNLETVSYGDIELQISDLGGHEDFRSFWKNFLLRSDIIVYVIDASDANRLPESKLAFETVLRYMEEQKPLLVLANKQDLRHCVSMSELLAYFQLLKLKFTWHIQETSAVTGQGIPEAFQWIYEQLTNQKIDPPLKIFELGVFNYQTNQSYIIVLEKRETSSAFSELVDLIFPKIMKHHFEVIHLRDYKVVLGEYNQYLIYLIIRKTDSESLAQELLNRVQRDIQTIEPSKVKKYLDEFVATHLKGYIEKINPKGFGQTSCG